MTTESIDHTGARANGTGETLLEVRNLVKYFPVHSSGVIRRVVGHVPVSYTHLTLPTILRV